MFFAILLKVTVCAAGGTGCAETTAHTIYGRLDRASDLVSQTKEYRACALAAGVLAAERPELAPRCVWEPR